MPTNVRKLQRGPKLKENDLMVMVFGTGMCHWSPGERRYFKRLWSAHGERVTRERREQDLPPAMMLIEVDEDRFRELGDEWDKKMDALHAEKHRE